MLVVAGHLPAPAGARRPNAPASAGSPRVAGSPSPNRLCHRIQEPRRLKALVALEAQCPTAFGGMGAAVYQPAIVRRPTVATTQTEFSLLRACAGQCNLVLAVQDEVKVTCLPWHAPTPPTLSHLSPQLPHSLQGLAH